MSNWGRLALFGRQSHVLQKQYLWNVPDGKKPDFSQSFTHGENISFSWNALNNSVYDLWLTSWNYNSNPMALCLGRAVNLAHDGSLNLTTPDTSFAWGQSTNQTRYALRFKPPTIEGRYIPSAPEFTSPGFFIVSDTSGTFNQKAVNESASTTLTTSTTSPAPSTSETSSPRTGFPIDTDLTFIPSSSTDTSSPPGSPGATAGMIIGIVLAVVLLVTAEVAFLLWRRRRRINNRHTPQTKEKHSLKRKIALKWPRKTLRRFGPYRERSRGGVLPVNESRTDEKEDDFGHKDLFNSPWVPNSKNSPELLGDSIPPGWGVVHELYGGRRRLGGRPGTLNSSLVELDAADPGTRRTSWEEVRIT
ncbi:hypothetical protein QBC35DRAFT_534202 [Podospora australis]|uniref:Mid2 domain-containing protein n=1 Tax=Podospora australis TaxID=1536484 RepID=A0AAN6WNR9_9PEZI|nr:hypothetical protein QBC35DRAFT_534202 [Podospora australis]